MNLRDLRLRVRALFAPNRVEHELGDELTFHLERETQKLVEDGMDPGEARRKAAARFGSVALAADQCRDERGTAFVDNTIRDIFYAFRMFARAPLASITIVLTVGLGLGLVTVLFSFLNIFLFRQDHVPAIHEMYAVERPRLENDERQPFVRAQYEAMRRETAVFIDAYAQIADIDSRVDGRMMDAVVVTGNFFQVLGVNAVLGRALVPADDERAAPQRVLVLSDEGWRQRFGGDPNVLGQKVIVNGAPFEVVGVMPEGFRGLAVGAPDFWAPLSLLAEFRPMHRGREDRLGLDIVGRLKPGVSPGSARAQLEGWYSPQSATSSSDRRGASILLEPRRGTIPQPIEALIIFAPLFFTFGLVLMIGCANVANLLLARALSRQREIGVRLSLGATRRRIIRQLLTESLLLALAAAIVGFGVSRLAIEGTLAAVLSTLPPDLGDIDLSAPASDWRVAVFLVAGAIASTAFFGFMPALQATRIEPVRTLRGEVIRDARPGRSRNLLIVLQVGASALLLICSAVFLRSALASATIDPGLRTTDTVLIDLINDAMRQPTVQAVAGEPLIITAAAVWPNVLSGRPAFAETGGAKARVSYKLVSPEYFSVLGVPIVQGRGFSDGERSSSQAVAIVSQSTARTLWPNGNAIGQTLQLEKDPASPMRRIEEPPLESRTFTIVGIARDVAGFRFVEVEPAGIYLPADTATRETSLVVRVNGDPELARQRLTERLTLVDPNMGQILTMRTMARMETYFLQMAFWATLVLGGLALALTVSGLFSVLSYLVEQRAKEIGVRMALGATARNVTQLVLSQTVRPVAYGLIAGGGLAAGLATILIALPAAATIAEIVHVTDPVAYLGSVLVILAACVSAASIPARRAAHLDPTQTLRQD